MPSVINSITREPLTEAPARGPAVANGAFEQSLARVTTQQVAAQRTRLTPGEASDAIRQAWTSVTGETPSDQTVALMTAQWAHETAHGASMYNYNFGGIKGTGPSGLSVEQKTREGWGRTERVITDHFRAYESAQEGATDYVKLLTRHYPEAISAAKTGDAAGFVRGLKQRGYFTGDANAYERSVATISAGVLNGSYADIRLDGHKTTVHQPPSSCELNPSPRLQSQSQVSQVAVHGTATHVYAEPLAPSALVAALSSGSETDAGQGNYSTSGSWQAVSTLSMADEVVRAALLQRSDEQRATGTKTTAG